MDQNPFTISVKSECDSPVCKYRETRLQDAEQRAFTYFTEKIVVEDELRETKEKVHEIEEKLRLAEESLRQAEAKLRQMEESLAGEKVEAKQKVAEDQTAAEEGDANNHEPVPEDTPVPTMTVRERFATDPVHELAMAKRPEQDPHYLRRLDTFGVPDKDYKVIRYVKTEKFQTVTAMDSQSNYSVEELRVAEYKTRIQCSQNSDDEDPFDDEAAFREFIASYSKHRDRSNK